MHTYNRSSILYLLLGIFLIIFSVSSSGQDIHLSDQQSMKILLKNSVDLDQLWENFLDDLSRDEEMYLLDLIDDQKNANINYQSPQFKKLKEKIEHNFEIINSQIKGTKNVSKKILSAWSNYFIFDSFLSRIKEKDQYLLSRPSIPIHIVSNGYHQDLHDNLRHVVFAESFEDMAQNSSSFMTQEVCRYEQEDELGMTESHPLFQSAKWLQYLTKYLYYSYQFGKIIDHLKVKKISLNFINQYMGEEFFNSWVNEDIIAGKDLNRLYETKLSNFSSPFHLTAKETKLIYYYTTNPGYHALSTPHRWNPYAYGFMQILSPEFSNHALSLYQIKNGLSKLPSFNGTTYKGLSFIEKYLSADLQKGDRFYIDKLISTSKNINVAIDFAKSYNFTIGADLLLQNIKIILQIQSDQGKPIAKLSRYPYEQEVLLPSHTLFEMRNNYLLCSVRKLKITCFPYNERHKFNEGEKIRFIYVPVKTL